MKDLLRRVAEKSLSDLKVDEEVERVVKLVREKGEKEQKVKRDEVARGLPSLFQRSVFALRILWFFGETLPASKMATYDMYLRFTGLGGGSLISGGVGNDRGRGGLETCCWLEGGKRGCGILRNQSNFPPSFLVDQIPLILACSSSLSLFHFFLFRLQREKVKGINLVPE